MSVISLLRDSSKDVDDGPAVPPLLSQKAYWFEVHVMATWAPKKRRVPRTRW